MCLRRDHDRRALCGRHAGDSLPRAHARAARHLLHAGSVCRAEDELVGTLVIQVNEARVGTERVGHLARDQGEHLFEIERRVDSLDRLGQQAEVSLADVHDADCRSRLARAVTSESVTKALLFLHLLSAFLFVSGAVTAGVLQMSALRRDRPSEIVLLLRITRMAVVLLVAGALGTLAFGLALAGHEGIGFGTGWVVVRVECPMYGTAPNVPDALSVRAGRFSRHRRLVPADTIAEINTTGRLIELRVAREAIRRFL